MRCIRKYGRVDCDCLDRKLKKNLTESSNYNLFKWILSFNYFMNSACWFSTRCRIPGEVTRHWDAAQGRSQQGWQVRSVGAHGVWAHGTGLEKYMWVRLWKRFGPGKGLWTCFSRKLRPIKVIEQGINLTTLCFRKISRQQCVEQTIRWLVKQRDTHRKWGGHLALVTIQVRNH